MGYRVVDGHGRDITITTPDSTGLRRLVVGANPLADHNERIAVLAETGERQDRKHPKHPQRLLSDYEARRPHPQDCGTPNCDNPVHFGGTQDGQLVFESLDSKMSSEQDAPEDKKA
ncbi:hypothetical protein LTR62_004007 [Meristemomyces frigidus]|uniref:Uncharacterized protein n=1 Tax=Meristemomyces frigidus TaxID=1508187 RepID=A0AAN7YKH8_9PEZI|nr:hypothetical protein LTR62_004007 [Meristemomyces frigidus]